MKNCYPIQSCNHFMHRAFLLLTSLFIILFVFSCGTQAYELNGTATGNILNNGYAAEADGVSVYADVDNGYALTLEKNEKSIVLDDDDAHSINICEDQIYYVSIEGERGKTVIRKYDRNSNEISEIYAVDLAKGIKNLYVDGSIAWFQSDSCIVSLDLNTGKTDVVVEGVEEFLPLKDFLVYTSVDDGQVNLYRCDCRGDSVVLLAENAVFFDCDDDYVYFSNGESGVYRVALEGGEPAFLGDGGVNIICDDEKVYWQKDDAIVSWEKEQRVSVETTDVEDVTSFAVLADGVEPLDEAVGEGGSGEDGSVSPMAFSPMAGMPVFDYKDWKQFDPRWGNMFIGSKTIADVGCLATSMSIFLVGSGATAQRYLNNDFDPGIFVQEMKNNGGFLDNNLVWGTVTKLYPTFKYKSDNKNFGSLNLTAQSIAVTNHRNLGNYIILGVRGNGHYVAADYGTGDDVYICDPGSNRITKLSEYGKASRAVVYSYSGSGWDGLLKKTTAPVITGKDVSKGTQITITCRTSNAKIYYTSDGTTPSASNGHLYTGPFVLAKSSTVKAIAVYPGYDDSDVTSQFFVVWNNPYRDVDSSAWYYGYIAQATDYGLFSGYEDKTFRPTNDMTRAEFVVALSRFLDIDGENYEHPFVDVGGEDASWYESAVAWAYTNKIVAGTTTTTFSPNEKITREQACAILVRFVDYLEMDLVKIRNYITFEDAKSISEYAKDHVKRAYEAGILNGSEDYGKLFMHPQRPIVRSEAATIMVNFLNLM